MDIDADGLTEGNDMSDTAANTQATETQAAPIADVGQGKQWAPPASQADLDRIIADRLSRERAKYADYEDLKGKAAKFDEAQEAAKTEQQKQAEALAEAQAKLSAYETREQIAAWSEAIVKDSPIPASALRGLTEEELREHFEQLSELITPQEAGRVVVTRDGTTPIKPVAESDWLRDQFKKK